MPHNGSAGPQATHWAEEEDPFVSGESIGEQGFERAEGEAPSPWAEDGGLAGSAYAEDTERAELDASEADLEEEDFSGAEADPASNEHESTVDFSPRGDEASGVTERLDSELLDRLVPFGPALEQTLVAVQIATGKRDPNALTDFVFFRRHPELKGARLGKGQEALMGEWRQIRDQVVRPVLGKLAGGPAPAPTVPAPVARSGDPSRELLYDGSAPAPGTTEARRSFPTSPPVRGDPSNRNRMLYDNVINQFAVAVNPRYAQRYDENGRMKSTYCNIFCWDVTRAMGAEIPHWVSRTGEPVAVGKGNEMNANDTNDWLQRHGARYGWRRVADQNEAQALANRGHPTIASMKKPGGIGHLAVIRPGEVTKSGPAMAQAGARNLNHTSLYKVFARRSAVELWTNDRGTAA